MATHSIKRTACLLAACWLFPGGAAAQSVLWDNPLGGDYQTAANWSTQSVPIATETAVFDLSSPGYSVLLSNFVTLLGLIVEDDNVTLDLNGFQMSVNDTFQLTSAILQTANLTIKNATVFANGASGVVIGSAGSVATLTLSGTTTRLLPVDIHVGGNVADSITGTLIIENQARAQTISGDVYVGRFDGNDGTLTVRDPVSALLIGGRMEIATGGSGVLEVTGGLVEQQDPSGWIVGPGGIVTVSGGGIIRSGGTVTPGGTTTIGSAPGATANVTVTGVGSKWELFGPTSIGELGPALVTIDAGGLVEARDPSPFLVGPDGVIALDAGGTLTTLGPVTVSGQVSIAAGALWDVQGTFAISPNGEGGTLSLSGGDLLKITNPDVFLVGPEGQVSGFGQFDGDLTTEGFIFPGDPTGTISVTGDFTQLAGGMMQFELLGTAAGQFDVLAVGGVANLGGQLEIQMGISPVAGQRFTIMTYASRTGSFDSIIGLMPGGDKSFDVDLGATALTLTTANVTGLSIAPDPIDVGVGSTVKASAVVALDVGGPTDASFDAMWLPDDPGVAVIDVDGTVTGMAPGTTTLRAFFDSFEATATVTVFGTSPSVGDDVCFEGSNAGASCSTDADCPGGVCGLKSRYITIKPGFVASRAVAAAQSIQVTIVSMPSFPEREGEVWWAGSSQAIPNDPHPSALGAVLVCEVVPGQAEVWPAGDLHLFGEPIIPGSTYEVRMCDAAGANCSDPLAVSTGQWGDVVSPFGGMSQPNFSDINAAVAKFQTSLTAPDTPRVDLVGPGAPGTPNTPNQDTNFADISADVGAFQGAAFPFDVPACP